MISSNEACRRIKDTVSLQEYATSQMGMQFEAKYDKPRSWYCPHCGGSDSKPHKSPPFCIYKPRKYKCFACDKSGSIIDLVMAHKQFTDESQVVKYLTSNNLPSEPIQSIIPSENLEDEKHDNERKSNKVKNILKYSRHATPDQLSKVLERRGFGELAKVGASILHRQRISTDSHKSSLNNEIQELHSLVVPLQDNDGNTQAVQKIGMTKFNKMSHGRMLGYYMATPLEERYKEVVVVESFFCAVALACIGYNAAAIFSTSNTKNVKLVKERFKDRDIHLWLDAGEDEKTLQCISEHAVRGLFWKNGSEKGFDINDLLKASCGRFSDEVRWHIENSLPEREKPPIEFVEPDTSDYKDIRHIVKDIDELSDRNILMFSAPTGTGKTYLYANEIVRMCYNDRDCKVTVLTNSIKSVDNIISKVRDAAKVQGMDIDVTRNVSDRVTEETHDQLRVGQVAVATYASLGRKGHTNVAKPAATELVKRDRVLFCDEIQALIDGVCKVNVPLASRFSKDKSTYRKVAKCPANRNRPNACASCIMAHKRESPDRYNKLVFPKAFSDTDLDSNLKGELVTERFDDLWDVSTYANDGGVFNKFLDESISYELDKPREIDDSKEDALIFDEFLEDLLGKLKYPQLSMVSPQFQEDNEAVNPSKILEMEVSQRTSIVKFPDQPCQVPHLKGYDILPILQILQASKIVMCSATIPVDTEKLLKEVLSHKDWQLHIRHVNKVEVKFNATFLVTSKILSQNTQVEICKRLGHRTLIAAKTKDICNSIYRGSCGENVEKFANGDFEDTGRSRASQDSNRKRITITYLRSALLTGLDYPDKDVMILNCQSFYPQIVCTERDKDKRRAEMIRQLQTMITQAIGRVLRTSKENRELGYDNRRIVFLLHGLDYSIEVNKELFESCPVVSERFITQNEKYQAICDAIDEARRGLVVSDHKAIEISEKQRKAQQQYMRTGKSRMSKSQRKHVDITPSDKRLQKLIEKAKRHTGTWREFYKSNNLDRLSKSHRKILSQTLGRE